MIDRFGGAYFQGNNTLQNPAPLSYILEAIQSPIYGKDLDPTIFKKAAAIGHRIICEHVFYDGNKRTAFEVMRLFLSINGYYLKIDSETIKKALDVAKGQVSIEDLANWLECKAIPIKWSEESSSS